MRPPDPAPHDARRAAADADPPETAPRAAPRLAAAPPPPFVLALAGLVRRLSANPDAARLARAALFMLMGVAVAVGGALADVALHRGVESGGETPVVRHPTGRDLATNADLTRFAPDQIPVVATALQANGFRYVRQSFAWSEIEPQPGQFVWERYDAIVAELTKRGIKPVMVLHRAPVWARPTGTAEVFDAPPVDAAAWERFVAAVVARYGEQAPFVQLWDLPNRADRWGGADPDPAAYVGLLAVGSNAVRSANPNATVVLAELDPAADDLGFLNAIYRAGGAPFFDVVAARVDGGDRTPYDRRVAADGAGLSRAVLFREAVVAAGDPAKPIWATHYGWQAAAAGERGLSGAEQAAYSVAGLERARAAWPWMGPMFAWGLAPGPELGGEVEPGRALIGLDGAPTPLLTALGGFAAAGGTRAAATGFLPVEAPQFVYEGNWSLQHLGSETYRTTTEVGARMSVRFVGTGARARLRQSRQAADLAATLDGRPIALDLGSFQAADVDIVIARALPDTEHELAIAVTSPGQFTMGGLVVERAVPLRWPIVLLVGAGAGLLFLGWRLLLTVIAERSGRLERQRVVDLWPELPHLPDWRPSRRA